MSAIDPADALQVGLYSVLSADSTLTGLASVYDGVPEGSSPPYVVIGQMTSTPGGVHGVEGRETVVTLHSWAVAKGFKPVNVIGARLVRLLHHGEAALDLATSGHVVWMVRHEFAQTLDDPEPGLRHRVDQFRVWTSQEGG